MSQVFALTNPWQGLKAWRVLDSHFACGFDFLTTWQSWRNDTERPLLLHYVALTSDPPDLTQLHSQAVSMTNVGTLVGELALHWHGLGLGFHRISLDEGRVLLTLCVGDLATLLRQQQFFADAVLLKSGVEGDVWDRWAVKALARYCRRGTRLYGAPPGVGLQQHLVHCGFELQPASSLKAMDSANAGGGFAAAPLVLGEFNPRWAVKHTRIRPWALDPPACQFNTPGRCVVLGAGLSGASVAAALARRGWQVQVLDAGEAPATGASGLPVGLVVPHFSADDCTLSRLSRSGVQLMLQHAQRLLKKGQDWDASGTLERRSSSSHGPLAALPITDHAWSRPAQHEPQVAEWLRTACAGADGAESRESNGSGSGDIADWDHAIWHAQAAWLKPATLVRAWLAQPGVTFQGHVDVAGLRREDASWAVLNAAGHVVARANRVVIANAMGALPLLASLDATLKEADALLKPLPRLHGVRGQVSWGLHVDVAQAAVLPPPAAALPTLQPPAHPPPALTASAPCSPSTLHATHFPPFPVNGAGNVVAHVPTAQGPAWFVGANYQPQTQLAPPAADNHRDNLARLAQLLPALSAALAPRFDAGAVAIWENTRCVTHDRLPLVGPLTAPLPHESQSSLWLCAGMGSRGLTFSALCAELLAAQWGGEPLPVEASLAAAMSTTRNAGVTSSIDVK